MRTTILGFLAAMLMAFALPASAADKIYSLNVSTSVPAGSNSAIITATFKNETPSGNSSFNSLTLGVTGGGMSIIGASVPSGTVTPTPSAGSPLQTINVTNMSPVKNGKTFTVTLTVKTNPVSGCVGSTAAWSSTTWTGSSLSGDNFAFQSQLSNVSTSVTQACSMLFTIQPQNSLSQGAIGGPVTVQGSPASVFSGVTLTLTPTSGSPVISGNSLTFNAGGIASFPSLSITGAGSYTLLASTGLTGYPTATSSAFTVAPSLGQLKCEGAPGTLPFTFGDPVTGGKRGTNKDGSACVPVAYDFQDNVSASNSVRLIWDTVTQKNASFEIWVDWKPELVANDGLPANTTYVAWKFDTLGNPTNKQPGRACLSNSLPQSYGTLSGYTAAVGTTPAKITINTTGAPAALPSAYAFAISIGDGVTTERLLVTGSDTPGDYNVLRAQGGTTAVDLASLVNTAPVMSNPLPLDSSATPQQMQMCIAEELWFTMPPGSVGCPANPQGKACIQYRSRVFDIGDGLINRDL